MSSKSSPTKKDDKITSSPTKKDDKPPPSLILTRNQSTYLNTRQLRNKDSSRKKISEFTQQLLGPSRERNKAAQSHKKKSPKDKKERAKPTEKKVLAVKINKLVLDTTQLSRLAGQKHKITAQTKETTLAKRARHSPPQVAGRAGGALTAQELIELCEEQSLDDDDFLEILTCESPVWWEETPLDKYYEDDMFTKADEMRHFQEIYKQSLKAEPITPATTNINIPTVKQNDDRFMKKRSKLENLLGNIKNKLADAPTEVRNKLGDIPTEVKNKLVNTPTEVKNNIPKDSDNKIQTAKANVASASTKDKLTKQELGHQRKKSTSESTSSSEDMFFGFQNDDVLKDFENMDIPVESVKKETKETTADNESRDNIDTKDQTTASSFLESSKTVTDCSKKKDSLFKATEHNTEECLPSNSNKNCNLHVSDVKICQIKSELNETDTFDGVCYVDTTTSNSNENITIPDTKETKQNTNESDSRKETEKSSSKFIKEEPNTVSNTLDIKKDNTDIKNDGNSKDSKKTDASSTNNNSVDNKFDKNNTTKDQEVKSNKSKHLYKDQLMAVYKIITDENYREKFKNAVTNKVEKVRNANGLESLLKNYNRKSYFNKRSLLKSNHEGIRENDDKIDAEEEKCTVTNVIIDCETNQIQNNEQTKTNQSTKEVNKDTLCENCDSTKTERSLNITSDVQSAKYCLKCSSIFESETCSYCVRKSQQGNQDHCTSKNCWQQSRKGNI